MTTAPHRGRWILTDTGPLYALMDPDDGHHTRARTGLADLDARGVRLMALYPTLMEAHSLILRRLGTTPALRWLDEFRGGAGTLIPRNDDYAGAIERLARFPDQRISLFDALLAEVSAAFELPVWTYDSDFDVMGIEVWGSETEGP